MHGLRAPQLARYAGSQETSLTIRGAGLRAWLSDRLRRSVAALVTRPCVPIDGRSERLYGFVEALRVLGGDLPVLQSLVHVVLQPAERVQNLPGVVLAERATDVVDTVLKIPGEMLIDRSR